MFRVGAVISLFFMTCISWCQEKGVMPMQIPGLMGVTRAMVVGISQYQNMTDLAYADRDAIAFATYLKSGSAGKIDSNNIKLILNEKATTAQVYAALDWLLEESREGDRIIIYFSGHGDALSKLDKAPGFLLCYDSPEKQYAVGNLSVYDLNDYIHTFNSKQIKVMLVVDACRSGKLSGNYVNGALMTHELLSKSVGQEIRLLSCGPNQYSIEGEQWGGGRGVFSYYLLRGLYGLADLDDDDEVSIFELNRYLEDHVSRDVSPQKQIPVVVSEDRDEIISVIQSDILSKQVSENTRKVNPFGMIESKSLEEDIVNMQDTGIRRIYKLFKQCLKNKILLQPANDCAEYYYQKLAVAPGLVNLHAFIKRNYAAALQDDAQQMMNGFLEVNVNELTRMAKDKMAMYQAYPLQIGRAMELLGNKHYLYKTLTARKLMFEGLLLYLESNTQASDSVAMSILSRFHQSIQLQSDNPVSYFYLSHIYATTRSALKNIDSCIYYSDKAIRHAESWILPYAYRIYYMSRYFPGSEVDSNLINKAWQVDSNDVFLLKGLGAYAFYKGQLDKSVTLYKRGLQLDSTDATIWVNLGACYHEKKDYREAEKYFKKSIDIRPRQFNAYYYLGFLYFDLGQLKLAEEMYLVARDNNPKNVELKGRLALLYLTSGSLDQAEQQCIAIETLDPGGWRHHFYRALAAANKKENFKSLEFLEKALQARYDNISEIRSNKLLEPVRMLEEFQILMKKYFPTEF